MPPPGCTFDRDDNGVPHLAADTEADLYRGLGWIHGRDRPLQVLLTRMAAWGRLAEHLPGADLLAADRAFRRTGPSGGWGCISERVRRSPRCPTTCRSSWTPTATA